jgi:hypothetical protein
MNRIVMVAEPGVGLHAEADHLVIRRNQASFGRFTLGSQSSNFPAGSVEVTPAASAPMPAQRLDLVVPDEGTAVTWGAWWAMDNATRISVGSTEP